VTYDFGITISAERIGQSLSTAYAMKNLLHSLNLLCCNTHPHSPILARSNWSSDIEHSAAGVDGNLNGNLGVRI
jgi:hypothetical protein